GPLAEIDQGGLLEGTGLQRVFKAFLLGAVAEDADALDLPADLDRPGRGFQPHASPTLVDEGPFELVHELELELGHRQIKLALGPSAALRCPIGRARTAHPAPP